MSLRKLFRTTLLTAIAAMVPSLAMAAIPGSYPSQLITRPLTAPGHMAEATATIDRVVFLGTDAHGLGLGARYGIDDRLEVNVGTGLRLNPNAGWGENISIGAGYSLLDSDGFDVAARLDIPLNFAGGDVLNAVLVSVPLRWQFAPKLAFRAGDGLLGIYPGSDTYTLLTGNVAVEYQANEKLAVGLGTQLFALQVTGKGDYGSTIADAVHLRLYGLYAVSKVLDVFARFQSIDVGDTGDFYTVGAGVNVRF